MLLRFDSAEHYKLTTSILFKRCDLKTLLSFRLTPTCIEEDDPEGGAGPHLAHQSQAEPDPVVLGGHEACADAGDAAQDLTEGKDRTAVGNVDGEQDDDVGQALYASHEARPHEQLQLAGVETEAVEAESDH